MGWRALEGGWWINPVGFTVQRQTYLHTHIDTCIPSTAKRTEGPDDFPGHGVVADVEILERALRLRAPVLVRGHRDRPHAARDLWSGEVGVGPHMCVYMWAAESGGPSGWILPRGGAILIKARTCRVPRGSGRRPWSGGGSERRGRVAGAVAAVGRLRSWDARRRWDERGGRGGRSGGGRRAGAEAALVEEGFRWEGEEEVVACQ